MYQTCLTFLAAFYVITFTTSHIGPVCICHQHDSEETTVQEPMRKHSGYQVTEQDVKMAVLVWTEDHEVQLDEYWMEHNATVWNLLSLTNNEQLWVVLLPCTWVVAACCGILVKNFNRATVSIESDQTWTSSRHGANEEGSPKMIMMWLENYRSKKKNMNCFFSKLWLDTNYCSENGELQYTINKNTLIKDEYYLIKLLWMQKC